VAEFDKVGWRERGAAHRGGVQVGKEGLIAVYAWLLVANLLVGYRQ
jgi:hypothetical protein